MLSVAGFSLKCIRIIFTEFSGILRKKMHIYVLRKCTFVSFIHDYCANIFRFKTIFLSRVSLYHCRRRGQKRERLKLLIDGGVVYVLSLGTLIYFANVYIDLKLTLFDTTTLSPNNFEIFPPKNCKNVYNV